jgi:hypothetical protein
MAMFDHGGGCPCGLQKECDCLPRKGAELVQITRAEYESLKSQIKELQDIIDSGIKIAQSARETIYAIGVTGLGWPADITAPEWSRKPMSQCVADLRADRDRLAAAVKKSKDRWF